jgi:hypothetical protein
MAPTVTWGGRDQRVNDVRELLVDGGGIRHDADALAVQPVRAEQASGAERDGHRAILSR